MAHLGVAALASELGAPTTFTGEQGKLHARAYPPYQSSQSHCQEAQDSVSSQTGSLPSRSLAALGIFGLAVIR